MPLSNGGVAEKRLKVSKTDRYTLNIDAWLNGETITAASVTGDAKATLSAADVNGGVIGWFATGVEKGLSSISVEYATATRTDCQSVKIIVINEC